MSIGGGTPMEHGEKPTNSGQVPQLKPLEVNGITAVTLGTLAWSIALVVLVFSRGWLEETGRTHWIWIAFSGVVLGLLGYRYSTNRVKRLGLERGPNLLEIVQQRFSK